VAGALRALVAISSFFVLFALKPVLVRFDEGAAFFSSASVFYFAE
jgi:hypothetical protein